VKAAIVYAVFGGDKNRVIVTCKRYELSNIIVDEPASSLIACERGVSRWACDIRSGNELNDKQTPYFSF